MSKQISIDKIIQATLDGIISKYNYKCYHSDIIKGAKNFNIMGGDITSDKITPDFCPFLLAKTRFEKLKELKDLN